jgi:hypothetical protein
MKNYLVALGVIFGCVASYADQVYTPLLVQCQGPDGLFAMKIDPTTQSVAFKLSQKGHIIQGNTKVIPGAKGEFDVVAHPASGSGSASLQVNSHLIQWTYIPEHAAFCRPTRASYGCDGPRPNIPAHFDWQTTLGVEASFEGNPDGTYKIGIINLIGTNEIGLVPVGEPNTCTVKPIYE